MKPTVAPALTGKQAVLPDIVRPVMAKVDVPELDAAWLERIGRAIQAAVSEVRWSHKEAAAIVNVDAAEFGKWLSGTRRPQFDKLFAVPELRCPLVIALASLAGMEIVTEIRSPRKSGAQ